MVSFLASMTKAHVLIMTVSALSTGTILAPAALRRPKIISESTRLRAQPKLIKATRSRDKIKEKDLERTNEEELESVLDFETILIDDNLFNATTSFAERIRWLAIELKLEIIKIFP